MIRVTETGRNPTMRYLARTHRVSVAWLRETFSQQDIDLVYELSAKMCADIYTKAFTDAIKWQAACDLINILDPARLDTLTRTSSEDVKSPAMSSPFAPDPQVHMDRECEHTPWWSPSIQRGGVPSLIISSYSSSLLPCEADAFKTCLKIFGPNSRVGRSWGAALDYERHTIDYLGGPTRWEYDRKPAIDVIGRPEDGQCHEYQKYPLVKIRGRS